MSLLSFDQLRIGCHEVGFHTFEGTEDEAFDRSNRGSSEAFLDSLVRKVKLCLKEVWHVDDQWVAVDILQDTLRDIWE